MALISQLTRHKILPFDILGDDPRTSEKQFQDFYFKLADHIHTAVSNYLQK